jgi:hypothetical protein
MPYGGFPARSAGTDANRPDLSGSQGTLLLDDTPASCVVGLRALRWMRRTKAAQIYRKTGNVRAAIPAGRVTRLRFLRSSGNNSASSARALCAVFKRIGGAGSGKET